MYLQQLVLANVRGFQTGEERVVIDFARPGGIYAGWTVIAGRNGTGKTTLLRAIGLALAGPTFSRTLMPSFGGWISRDEKRATVRAAFSIGESDGWGRGGQPPKKQAWAGLSWTRNDDGPEPSLSEDLPPSAPKETPRRGPWYENPSGWFVAGYGPMRRLTGAASEAQRLMLGHKRVASMVTLFEESASLAESTWWLQELYPRKLENNAEATLLLDTTLEILNNGLMPDGSVVTRYDSAGLWIRRDDTDVLLEEMSDGYRVVVGLVIDIVRRLYAAHGALTVHRDDEGILRFTQEGVVLIDEIDAHLHVSWQQQIGFWMKDHFPNIQFIVTTHSPFVCQAASPRGLIRLATPEDATRFPQVLNEDDFDFIVNADVNRVVMSKLFGMESTLSERTEELKSQLSEMESSLLVRTLTASSATEVMHREDDERRVADLREELALSPSQDVLSSLRAIEKAILKAAANEKA